MKNIFRTASLEISRVLLQMAFDRELRKKLPQVFARLDQDLPYMLMNKAKPAAVKTVIADIIEEKIGRAATTTQVNAVIGLYDPVKAAFRNITR